MAQFDATFLALAATDTLLGQNYRAQLRTAGITPPAIDPSLDQLAILFPDSRPESRGRTTNLMYAQSNAFDLNRVCPNGELD